MIATKIKSPSLEFVTHSHETLIHAIYTNIRHIRLCWLAEEELELKFPDNKISDDLYYDRQGDVIRIRLRNTHKILAKICF